MFFFDPYNSFIRPQSMSTHSNVKKLQKLHPMRVHIQKIYCIIFVRCGIN